MRTQLLLRALWNQHRRASIIALCLAGALLATPFMFCGGASQCGGTAEGAESAHPNVILDRVWLDAYPEDARSELSIWIWLSSGVGAYQQGSSYRAAFDVFEFARNGVELETTFLQDSETATSSFHVSRCDELPPFDLCLTIEDPARGPSQYYGFSDQAAYARELPRAADFEARARASVR